MFLKNKKGDITLQQVVLIVLAVAMIFIVLSFGSKIWQSFFPSADKSTTDSFNTLYNVINAKTYTDKSYDMTPVTSYIGDDYCIIYFYSKGDSVVYYEDGKPKTFYKPTICKNEPCLCLYDDVNDIADEFPGNEEDEKDEDIINCKPVKNSINIDDKYYDFNGAICGDDKTYTNYLIIRRSVTEQGSSANNPYLYILKDSDEKRAEGKTARELHNMWNVPICQGTNICGKKNADEVIYPKDDQDFDKFYNECNIQGDKHYASISITCEYDASKRTCQPNCVEGDVLDECKTTYKTCEGYNQVLGVDKYITSNIESEDYKYYYMCKNDVKYCGAQDSINRPNGCEIDTIKIYARKYSEVGTDSALNTESNPTYNPEISGAIIENELSTILNPTIKEECKIKTINIPVKSNNVFLSSYDESIENCKTHVNKYFYEQSTVMGCKQGSSTSCNDFIEEIKNKDFKSIKYIQNPLSKEIFWITYYDSSKITDSEINLRFEPIQKCVTVIPVAPAVTQ